MGKENFRISQKKYNQALELLLEGDMSYREMARKIGISRNTLQKIREDEDTYKYLRSQADETIKTAVGKAGRKAVELLDAKSEMVRLEAIKFILALNGIQVTEKIETEGGVNIVISGSDELED